MLLHSWFVESKIHQKCKQVWNSLEPGACPTPHRGLTKKTIQSYTYTYVDMNQKDAKVSVNHFLPNYHVSFGKPWERLDCWIAMQNNSHTPSDPFPLKKLFYLHPTHQIFLTYRLWNWQKSHLEVQRYNFHQLACFFPRYDISTTPLQHWSMQKDHRSPCQTIKFAMSPNTYDDKNGCVTITNAMFGWY